MLVLVKKNFDPGTGTTLPISSSATVVDLVRIAPAAGFVQPACALMISLIGSLTNYLFVAGKSVESYLGLKYQHERTLSVVRIPS